MSGALLASWMLVGVIGTPDGVSSNSVAPASYIQLWTSNDDVLRRGDRVHVYFRTDEDAYITIFRVDTDGRVRVLFPHAREPVLEPAEWQRCQHGHVLYPLSDSE